MFFWKKQLKFIAGKPRSKQRVDALIVTLLRLWQTLQFS
jgi:hypothetical protein